MAALKKICPYPNLIPANVTLFGKTIFANMVKVRPFWIIQVNLNPVTNVLIRGREKTQTQRKKLHEDKRRDWSHKLSH
jgi:hypothetical protein